MSNVNINKRTSVHAGSGGSVTSPDVCKTPRRCRPQVYSNVAKSTDAVQTSGSVKVNGNPACNKDSIFSKSSGDEPGTCGGTASGTIKQKAEFVTFSPNVSIEGLAAVRNADLMTSNNRNTPPMPIIQSGSSVAPSMKPEGANGLEPDKYPSKIVPLLICNSRPIGLNGVITAIGQSDEKRFTINLGSADDIGKEIRGQTRWALTQHNVPDQNYDTFLSLVDSSVEFTKEQTKLLKDNKHPVDNDVYHIPLAELPSINKDKKIDYSNIELTPVYPARLLKHNESICAPLRDGWLYIYVGGYLWREIKVNSSKNEFSDVNITKYQGNNRRPANVQLQDNVILLPRVLGDLVDIQFAYSEKQWSWAYIERMGGMDKKDCRYLPNLAIYIERKKNKYNAKLSKTAQKERFQKTSLSLFRPATIKSSSIYSTYLVQIKTAVNENFNYTNKENLSPFQFQNFTFSDIQTELPVLVIYDAIGEARSRAIEYHNALMTMQTLMAKISGKATVSEIDLMSSKQKRQNEIQSIKYKMACVIHQYLYVGTEQVTLDYMTSDEKQDFNNSLKDRKKARDNYLDENDYFKFTHKKQRKEQQKKIKKLKYELTSFLSDDKSDFNFSIAMCDLFSLDDENYYLYAMQCMSEIFKDILKAPKVLDAHLNDDVFDQLEFMQSDSGVELMLNILNLGENKHKLHDYLFAKDASISDEESSLSDFTESDPGHGCPDFNSKKLAQLNSRLLKSNNGDQEQVYRRFGEAMGGWTELHANFAFSFYTAEKILSEQQQKINSQGDIEKDFKVSKQLKLKYKKLYKNIKRWRIIINHLMRVHSIVDIIPIETVPLPVENIVRGPYPQGYLPLDIETKQAHANLRLAEIKKGLNSKAVKLEVSNQFGKSLGSHDLKSILNLEASLSTAYDITQPRTNNQSNPTQYTSRNYVEILLFRQGKKKSSPVTKSEVDELLKEQTMQLKRMTKDASDLSDEIARSKIISDITIDPKLRKEVLMRSGYNTVILPLMFAVNVWNFMSHSDKISKKTSSRNIIDGASAGLDMMAISTEVARVISVHINGELSPAQLTLAKQHGIKALFDARASIGARLLLTSSVLSVAAGTVTAGISLYDMCAAFSVGDSGAMLGHGFVATGAGLAAASALMSLPWIGGTLVGLGATGIGLIAIALILIGVGIIWLFRDLPIETWLKNCAWGKTHDSVKIEYDKATKKYKRIRTPIKGQRYGSRSDLAYQANKSPVYDWIIPDVEYNAWKIKPELAFQRLMDIINRPHIQFKDRKPSSEMIVLQIICPGFLLGQASQDLILEYEGKTVHGVLSLASNNEVEVKRGLLLSKFWKSVEIKLVVNPLNKNQVDGLELHIPRHIFVDSLQEGSKVNLKAKLKHWPIGKNKTLSSSITNLYSLPDPERDDDGNVKDLLDEFLLCETEITLRTANIKIESKAL